VRVCLLDETSLTLTRADARPLPKGRGADRIEALLSANRQPLPSGILPRMWRLALPLRSWLCIALLAMLVIRLGEMHLHLCFDGQEPASAVHVGDSPSHDDASHSDQDVELSTTTGLIKKAGADTLDLLFVCLFVLLLLPALRRITPPSSYRFFVPPSPARFLPPLRGPPL